MSLPDFSNLLIPVDGPTKTIYHFSIHKATVSGSYNLPQFLFDACNSAIFDIPNQAIETINFLFSEASRYSGHELFRHYDTVVRDSLHHIAFEMVYKAIELFTDYMMPHKSALFDKRIIRRCIAYQLFSDYVGRGLIKQLSKIEKQSYLPDRHFYQNDYWLERIIKNEETIQEQEIQKNKNYQADEAGFQVQYEPPGVVMSLFKITFFYAKTKYVKQDDDTFESKFIDDVPEKTTLQLYVYDYHITDAIRAGFNYFSFNVIGDDNWLQENILDFNYKLQYIHELTTVDQPCIQVIK
jgi:hypothetical protein